jgi:hypothetical protein
MPLTYQWELNNQRKEVSFHLTEEHQNLSGKCENCNNTSKQLTGEINNLAEFSHLKGINTSNNQLTNLNFLNGLNLFGNQVQEIDFADLWTKFPNLEGY